MELFGYAGKNIETQDRRSQLGKDLGVGIWMTAEAKGLETAQWLMTPIIAGSRVAAMGTRQ